MKSQTNTVFLIISLCLAVLTSCDRDRNHPGWDFFPDMFYSNAYETYSKNPVFEDKMTMRVPAPGSIPLDYIPFEYTPDADSRKKAGEELENPFPATSENIERGKTAYNIFCVGCHGPTGTGDGRLFILGVYPMKPRPVAGPGATNLPDGAIYHTITLGFGSMGPHGSQVRPDDRWKIVHFIRQLQNPDTSSFKR